MAIQKAEAIVLHRRRQGETSKIVTLYTREFGRLMLMAKGSRGTRSKYLGTLETFNHISIVFYRKEERGLQYLSQASILSPLVRLHGHLGRIALASIPCEIIDKSEIGDQPHPQQFQLLLDTLTALDANDGGLRNIVRAFLLQFAVLAGFQPQLDACRFCGRLEADSVNYFLLRDGSYSCAACGLHGEEGRRLNSFELDLLRWLARIPVADAAQAQTDKQSGEVLDMLLVDYLTEHIEALAGLKSFKHLQILQSHLKRTVSD